MKALPLITAVALASQHPVRQEIVEEILLRATSWKPRPVQENHLRHLDLAEIQGMMGLLGTQPFGNDHFSVIEKAYSTLHSLFGGLGDWRNWDVEDDDVKDEPKEEKAKPSDRKPVEIHSDADQQEASKDVQTKAFSWLEKMPECIGPIQD